MTPISPEKAKRYGLMVVIAAWMGLFCMFGYRSSFSIMQGLIIADTGWTTIQTSLGYCFMMVIYAITSFFCGSLIDKKGCKPVYAIGALCCFLGFFLTSFLNSDNPNSFYIYLFTYGLFAGVGTGMLGVTPVIACHSWFVGTKYATMYGFAFMGAPMAQLLLTLVLKPVLQNMGWQVGMKVLAVIMAVALIIAALITKKGATSYGIQPFGTETLKKSAVSRRPITLREAFSTYAIWCDIGCFLTAMAGEFLIWSQAVGYFQTDMNLSLNQASNIYLIIGICGIFTMPFAGKLSDIMVKKLGHEPKARKVMLLLGPTYGIIAILLCLTKSIPACMIAMFFLAMYWGTQAANCAGYASSMFGGPTFGRIWGFATLIVMGIGPAFGTFMGTWFKDNFGLYKPAFIFSLCAFAVALILACTLPLRSRVDEKIEAELAAAANSKS